MVNKNNGDSIMRDADLLTESGEELYFRFLAGDNDAFEGLVRMYEDELSRYLFGVVNDYYEAKHLAIETFSHLVLNSKKFGGQSSLKTYLFAIGKNLALQLMKKRGREQHLSLEDVMEIQAAEDKTPHIVLEQDENRRILKEAMQTLKDDYHAVLALIYFEDMSYRQAGRVMGKTEKQIKNLAHRAKLALKKQLETGGYTNV